MFLIAFLLITMQSLLSFKPTLKKPDMTSLSCQVWQNMMISTTVFRYFSDRRQKTGI